MLSGDEAGQHLLGRVTTVGNGDRIQSIEGADSFIYQICNTAGQCDTATVTTAVGP